ncbi:MAG: Xaa-Pro peptidase family protein [Paraglaciecola sp.]|uniref:M24 family metallopeptidase n=1 Tax=Flavobacterium sp. W21_SRS_FM6 TaxID=3240268 RepID=UPI00273E401A|nr:Xaa-Pro peptidase family protein [Paraglaciecola sp.]MDP5031356.1 Xaa-Pro peptidase family protein [Paraglaciecola sp.]MDP5131686.1 Xaa-Pro peptidase family protein [Paraglaciecola sp.]
MNINKRQFLKVSGAAIASLSIRPVMASGETQTLQNQRENVLRSITDTVKPITVAERQKRIAKAQSLMVKHNIAALILEPGAAMDYFTGIQWWRSERLTAVVLPREGDIAVVCPFFEEPSIRESLKVGKDVRVWQEHESPFALVKQILVDRGVAKANGSIAFEHSVRYFVLKGVMELANDMVDVRAEPVTLGCRMYKSAHELALMHKANEITLEAYAHVWSKLELGMSQDDVKSLMSAAQSQLGGSSVWNMALFNEASAYPHGTRQSQTIREGSIVLMDCGCAVEGYQSDISRTFVVGEPSKQQTKIWNTVRQGQTIAFETAQLGVAAGKVDDAVRQYYVSQGLGPEYKLPGLSHRTGHGIGMEGHESVNFVHGETALLKAGMCFSNEPGIYLPGDFGVRLEDCIYMTEKGPQWFTVPPESLTSPIGKLAALVNE